MTVRLTQGLLSWAGELTSDMLIVRSAHEELRRWLADWNRGPQPDGHTEYDSRAQFYHAYSSLVLYSFGLENALERSKMDISFFLTNVYEAASRVCNVVKNHFLPRGYLPYLPDTNFVMCSYAVSNVPRPPSELYSPRSFANISFYPC